MSQVLLSHVDDRGVATLTLNRPEVHNAFDDNLIAALTRALENLAGDTSVRAVVLSGAGRSFSAGGDLSWMRACADWDEADNLADARRLAALMRTLHDLPLPTIARVHGHAFGGGVGLIACCDIAVASDAAQFGLTEVRLGLVPAVISPFVVAAIGRRHARRWFLTGARFDAATAREIGLVHAVATPDDIDSAVDAEIDALLAGGPAAIGAAKALVAHVATAQDTSIDEHTAQLIARLRVSPEGQEGLAAFLDKRRPGWRS